MRRWRMLLSVAGIALAAFGAVSLVSTVPFGALAILVVWMIGAVVVHDGIIAPVTVLIGWTIGRFIPPRARRYVQTLLIAGGLVTIIAIPLILRRNTQPASKAILQQNYAGNLTLLLGLLAAVSLVAYCAHVASDLRRTDTAHPPTPDDGR